MADQDDMLSRIIGASATRDVVPRPNETYVILDRASGAALAICEGELRLERDLTKAGNCYWRSVEKDGWMGFRETQLGRYLGHDFWWKFRADKTEHSDYGYFVPRRLADGGYVLLAPSLGKLLQLVAGKNGELGAAEKGGTAWEFIRVDTDQEEEEPDDDDEAEEVDDEEEDADEVDEEEGNAEEEEDADEDEEEGNAEEEKDKERETEEKERE
ncbi:uncharacterized protein MAM_02460 [Metarhizium album ARSEF 1941]|uniref:Uncharacterized protein n=1 Tax=Metarhizium album (strain ARSEF 1941) TaxID=1081103 RepID=A0A0B2X1Q3_METAS|nr:uncharacterized protein MAM_02460 [Metarhizium album ARSEF 1941]KHN99607.1 hypothetical protein MAM_02460 [Metarhizium album ARSEF 1941]